MEKKNMTASLVKSLATTLLMLSITTIASATEVNKSVGDVAFENSQSLVIPGNRKVRFSMDSEGALLYNMGYVVFCQRATGDQYTIARKDFIGYNPFDRSQNPISESIDLSNCVNPIITFVGETHAQSDWLLNRPENVLKVSVTLLKDDNGVLTPLHQFKKIFVTQDMEKLNSAVVRGKLKMQ